MMNPSAMMKLMQAKNQFTARHPKFSAFCKDVFGRKIEAGTVVEITITRPGEEPITANMRVSQEDLELLQSMQELAK